MEYRYMIYNNMKKEFQFPRICETTEKGAQTILFKLIGNDARKYRFEIKKLDKESAYKIRKEIKLRDKARQLKERFLEKMTFEECLTLVIENERRKDNAN